MSNHKDRDCNQPFCSECIQIAARKTRKAVDQVMTKPLETRFSKVQGKKLFVVSGSDEITMLDGTRLKLNPEPLETPSELDELSLEQFFLKLGYHRHKPNPAKRYVFKVGGSSLTKIEAMELRQTITRLIAEEVRKATSEIAEDMVALDNYNEHDDSVALYLKKKWNDRIATLTNTESKSLQPHPTGKESN